MSADVSPESCNQPTGCVLPGDDEPIGAADAAPFDATPESGLIVDAGPEADAPPTEGPVGTADTRVLSAGQDHTCAILDGGFVKCWGNNNSGGLGIAGGNRGDNAGEMGAALPAVPLFDGGATEVHAGNRFSCVAFATRQAMCWGRSGILGRADAGLMVDVGESFAVASVSAGDLHACALSTVGSAQCWGANGDGQLAAGDLVNRFGAPVAVQGLPEPAVALTVGHTSTCALLSSGKVSCWGRNLSGELGTGTTTRLTTAGSIVDLGTGYAARQVVAAQFAYCALLRGGAVKCWGQNDAGQLGLGDTNNRGDQPGEMGDALPPVALGSGLRVSALLGSHANNFCARFEDGSFKCWGDNAVGQLGLGDNLARLVPPAALPFPDAGGKVAALGVGEAFVCAHLESGSLRCWGSNGLGQLGQGGTAPLFAPGPNTILE